MKFYALKLGALVATTVPNFVSAKDNSAHVQVHCIFIVPDVAIARTGIHGGGFRLHRLSVDHMGFCKEKVLNRFSGDNRIWVGEGTLEQAKGSVLPQPKSDTLPVPAPYPKQKPHPHHKPFPHPPNPAPDPVPKPVPPPAPRPVPEPLKY